jgi:hypothetical protein
VFITLIISKLHNKLKEREDRMIKRNKKYKQDASPTQIITLNNSNFVRSIMALSKRYYKGKKKQTRRISIRNKHKNKIIFESKKHK